MPALLEATTSTAAGDPVTTSSPGEYELHVSIPGSDAATVVFEKRINESGSWMPLSDIYGERLTLSRLAPMALVTMGSGQQIRATRTGGSAEISVLLTKVE